MINVLDFNPVDGSTQTENNVIIENFLNPANIYKMRLKTFYARKGGAGPTQILPRLNIKKIAVTGINKQGEPISEKMIRDSYELGLFMIDFGEMITQVQLIITLDSDFSTPLVSGNNSFTAIVETNESYLDLRTPLTIAKRDCSNQVITSKTIIKAVTITADASNPGPITIQGYGLSDNDGGASFNHSIEAGKSETFIGSMTLLTVVHTVGPQTANFYTVTGYRG